MSFIYRDYNKPRIAIHSSKIMRKSLFAKIHPKVMLGGIEVFGTCQVYQDSQKVTSNKTFKRFLKNIGTSYKEMNEQILGSEGIDKVENIYFKMDQSKLLFTTKSIADIVAKLNANYFYDMIIPTVLPANVFYYGQGRSANEIIATLPSGFTYGFVNGVSVFNTTTDGFFSIDSYGNISITTLGVTPILSDPYDVYSETINPPTNKMNHDGGGNLFSYIVRKTDANAVSTDEVVTLKLKRDYIDVQITIGGDYTNTIDTATSVDGGVPAMFNDLVALRLAIESNPMQYLAGIYPTVGLARVPSYNNNINIGSKKLSMRVADISYDSEWGHELDTLAVLDDGELFEVITPVIGEVLEITPISVQAAYGVGRASVQTQLFNMSYTYTKRFKVKAMAVDTSVLITRQDTIASKFKLSTTKNTKPFGIGTISLVNTMTVDSTIKDAVRNLHTDFYYQDNAVFHRGRLRVDAFNAMTANEFHTVFTKCFTTGFTKKKTKWWKKVLAIVIIIIAIVIIILSYLFPPFAIVGGPLANAMMALALGMLFITLAGMVYAKHVGDETGMKMIAGATQAIGITLAIVAICNGYADAMTAYEAVGAMSAASAGEVAAVGGTAAMNALITSAMIDVGVAALTVGVGVASLAVNTLGVGGEKERQIVNAASAVVGAYQGLNNTIAGFSAPSVGPVQNVTNFVNLAASGYKGYLLIDSVGTKAPSLGAEEQAVPEDGIESVYLLETRTVAFDAIEALNERLDMQYGVNITNGIKQKQYA